MGCTSKKAELPESFTTQPDLLSKFNELSNNPSIIELESKLSPFQYTYNYYLLGSSVRYSKININFDDPETKTTRTSVSRLLGTDDEGSWVYIGECLESSQKLDGRGYLIHTDKSYKFQGYFKDGLRNGRGRLMTSEKILEGDWIDREIVGEGKEIKKDGSVYIGKFVDCLYEGLGKMVFPDKSSYSGEFAKGEKNGYGEYNWTDGSKYLGNWKTGKFHGIGKYLDAHGNIFEGGWKENQMDGYGEYIWKDGRKYKGNYYNGKKHGYGEMYYIDGKVWRGNWKSGKMHGSGNYIIGGEKKTGIWYEGRQVDPQGT